LYGARGTSLRYRETQAGAEALVGGGQNGEVVVDRLDGAGEDALVVVGVA